MKSSLSLLASAAAALLPAATVYGSTVDHRYSDGEHVELWVNKVRSYIIVMLTALIEMIRDIQSEKCRCHCESFSKQFKNLSGELLGHLCVIAK